MAPIPLKARSKKPWYPDWEHLHVTPDSLDQHFPPGEAHNIGILNGAHSSNQLAFHGLAGRIVRTIEPASEADPMALLVQILVAYGNVIGRSAHFAVEADKHHVNEFVVLIGRTAKARKGTSWGHVERLFREADEEWANQRVQSGASSGEGLIWAVRDPVMKRERHKEGRSVHLEEVEADPGISDKRLLVYEPEYANVLKQIEGDSTTRRGRAGCLNRAVPVPSATRTGCRQASWTNSAGPAARQREEDRFLREVQAQPDTDEIRNWEGGRPAWNQATYSNNVAGRLRDRGLYSDYLDYLDNRLPLNHPARASWGMEMQSHPPPGQQGAPAVRPTQQNAWSPPRQ